MNSILNYGSDDDFDDSSEEKQTDWRGTSSKDKQGSSNRQTDANYEEVQMDLSEGSNDSKAEARDRRSRERDSKDRRERDSKERDRSRHEKDRRSSRDKESRSRSDHNRRDRDRDRERKSRRSTSRERRRSRSPRRSDRSRSRSRDRSRKYSKRYDKGMKSQTEKIVDPQKGAEDDKRTAPTENDRFFMPGITGRFRDQIERRKQLWQKKDNVAVPQDNKIGQPSKKVWETTTFAQDTDGKVANKFKRLMGIRGNTEASGQGVDVLRKQEEMFSSMEQQYEVARTATHTMRGVGLGFGSYQR